METIKGGTGREADRTLSPSAKLTRAEWIAEIVDEARKAGLDARVRVRLAKLDVEREIEAAIDRAEPRTEIVRLSPVEDFGRAAVLTATRIADLLAVRS